MKRQILLKINHWLQVVFIDVEQEDGENYTEWMDIFFKLKDLTGCVK